MCVRDIECYVCEGSGKCPEHYSEFLFNTNEDCPECEGKGTVEEEIQIPIEDLFKEK